MKRTRQTIKAGAPGTKKYLRQYGPKLLYVRHYYDWKNRKRKTTVEFIIDKDKWEPKRIPAHTKVNLKVGLGESSLQKTIKERGGKWNKGKGVWEIEFGKVKELGLQSRMVRK
jgi:hypothetical protein